MNLISNQYTMIEFLYNINDLKNLISIFKYGLLSKNSMQKYGISHYTDLSNSEVQKRRDNKKVPNHKFLHDYANVYIDARNPMMYYEIRNKNIDELCVICVDKKVLDLDETIVTDRNAAAEIAYFGNPKNALKQLDFNAIQARYWIDEDILKYSEKKSKKCAEVLVLDKIPVKYLIKIKVATEIAKRNVTNLQLGVPVEIDSDIFFK